MATLGPAVPGATGCAVVVAALVPDVCAGADCAAAGCTPLAQDLREEVVKLMASGRDDGQIKSFLVDRYGEFVLYRPALSPRNALLWLGPFLLLVGGAVAWWRLGRRKPPPAQSAQEALEHVDELLGQRR